MSERCTICNHVDRLAIEQDVRTGAGSLKTIAHRYGLSKTALLRHRGRHMVTEEANAASAPTTLPHPRVPQPAQETLISQPPSDAPDEASGAVSIDAEDIPPLLSHTNHQKRVRQSLMLRARGIPRSQIAHALEVSERTITEWWAKVQKEQIAKLHAGTAETFIADLLSSRDIRMAELYHLHDRARDKGDAKTVIAVHRLLEVMDRTVFTMAQSLGVLEGFKPGAREDKETESLLKFARDFASIMSMDATSTDDQLSSDVGFYDDDDAPLS